MARTKDDIKRTRIMHSAKKLFGTKGIDAVSLDDIARSSEASKNTILNHFGSKDGLVMAIIERSWGKLVKDIETATSAAGTQPRDDDAVPSRSGSILPEILPRILSDSHFSRILCESVDLVPAPAEKLGFVRAKVALNESRGDGERKLTDTEAEAFFAVMILGCAAASRMTQSTDAGFDAHHIIGGILKTVG